MGEARRKAADIILESKRFKAVVNPPPGRTDQISLRGINNPEQVNIQVDHHLDVDDQFFHVTCHVEESMRGKIQRGEYVDLQKLLPKPCNARNAINDNKLDLVYRDGHSFFVPSAASEVKINGIRRWEQAFRIYAAIYSQANPLRAAEIWQYVHIINTAASAYVWDNVANYDFTFRQLMSTYPQRSWAKIYNQMWNIAMRDLLLQNNQFGANSGSRNSATASYSGNTAQTLVSSASSSGDGKQQKCPNYFWSFNKGGARTQSVALLTAALIVIQVTME